MKKLLIDKEIDALNEIMTLLGYHVVERKKSIYRGLSRVKYQEKEVVDYEIRKKYMVRSTIPFIYIIICTVLAALLATTFLILVLVLRGNIDKLLYFYCLMFPAFIFIILASFLSFKRYFNSLHNLESAAGLVKLKEEVEKNVNTKHDQ